MRSHRLMDLKRNGRITFPVHPAFTGARLKPRLMPVSRLPLSLILFGLLGAAPALAADPAEHGCLDKAEQRVAVAAHKAVPLAEVIKTRRERGLHGEVLRARLCRRDDGLVYVLTLLGHSGTVVRTTVDAASGEVIGGR